AARGLLGRKVPDRRQGSLLGVDAVARERAGLSLAAIKKPAIRRHMQIGGSGLLLEIGRQRIDKLQLGQCPGPRTDGVGADRVGGLGDQIKKAPAGVQRHMTRSGAGPGLDDSGPIGDSVPFAGSYFHSMTVSAPRLVA